MDMAVRTEIQPWIHQLGQRHSYGYGGQDRDTVMDTAVRAGYSHGYGGQDRDTAMDTAIRTETQPWIRRSGQRYSHGYGG